jgi:hypothetical protein
MGVVPDEVGSLLAGLDEALPGRVEALHVTGGVALGDYRPGVSDIDMVVVLAEEPTVAQVAALRALHAARAGRPHLDATYLSRCRFDARADDAPVTPHVVDGEFHDGQRAFQLNPVTWAELAGHAITVRGRPPAAEGVRVDPDRLRAWNLANLRGYWADLTAHARRRAAEVAADRAIPVGALAWHVLGPPRLLHTVETGGIVSKTAAGRAAARRFPAHAALIGRCLRARAGEPVTATMADVPAACDLAEAVMAAAEAA